MPGKMMGYRFSKAAIASLTLQVLFNSGSTAFVGSALPMLRASGQDGGIACSDRSMWAHARTKPLQCSAVMAAESDNVAKGRRDMLGALLCGAAFLASPGIASAKAGEPVITDKVFMEVSIQGVNAASKGSEERESNISKQAAGR